MKKIMDLAAIITGNALAGVGLFVIVHNVIHRGQDQWWDGKFVAGLIAGGLLLAYYERVGRATERVGRAARAIKDFIPITWKGGQQ